MFLLLFYPSVFFPHPLYLSDVMRNIREVKQFQSAWLTKMSADSWLTVRHKEIHTSTFKYMPGELELERA